ncbi:uncharacterized protein N7477_007565 [Penicillium maclennaniae]|uniref:uncharacterized protein n=1 Tax=Penicillium maclennaniae TaxID=1343394 RepID=UPI002540618E|nr:uncharacterized protein N7477_007565 [Penicillium maclennaniae]KAJ5665117.1 hypothetical protein N7477_007565 [Penicillium maclennaniae]
MENKSSLAPQSQSFMAFDLLESTIVVKQYYLPGWRALAEGKTKLSVVKEAVQTLPAPASCLKDSINMFNEFFDSFPEHSKPAIEIVAIDCLDPSQSRLKGGRAPKTCDEEDSLRELWCSVFGLDPHEYHSNQPLGDTNHRTGGILYYFELKKGTKTPKSKIYLPVRHYAQSDEQISRGLSNYLARRDKALATGSYYEEIKKLCTHRDLANGLGFHTYVSWASERDKWNVTAYFNPEIYHESRF